MGRRRVQASALAVVVICATSVAARPALQHDGASAEFDGGVALLTLGSRHVSIGLRAIGRGDETRLAPGAHAQPREGRVALRRPAMPGVDEWWRDTESGLEHGVTIDRRSAGRGELVLDLDVRGLEPRSCDGAIALMDGD